jgi:hypothetical protein
MREDKMDMKYVLQTGLATLGLMTSMVLAAPVANFAPSANGETPVLGVVLQASDCPAGTTFYKNMFPGLTNGQGSGQVASTFSVDQDGVSGSAIVTLAWDSKNAFSFTVEGGAMHKLGAKVDANDLLYDYVTLPGVAVAQSSDQALSQLDSNKKGADVNHIDFCLGSVVETPDTTSPEVTITQPGDGDTVSGTVIVRAIVTDDVEVSSVTASVNGAMLPSEPSVEVDEFAFSWNTSDVADGSYTILVTATDSSNNTTTDSVIVTVVTSLADCLEGDDGVPGGLPSANGCNKTTYLQLEYPEALRPYVGSLSVTQAAIPALAGVSSTAYCDTAGDSPLVVHDPRVSGSDGKTVVLNQELDLGELFDIQQHYDDFHDGDPAPLVKLGPETVGSPCLALVHQNAPDFSELSGLLPPGFVYPDGPIYTVTQLPALVPGIFILPEVGPLDIDPASPYFQPDLQFIEEAAYQPDDLNFLVTALARPFTNDVYNPPRTSGFKGSFFPLNTREACLGIAPALAPPARAYYEAVFQCKKAFAIQYQDETKTALEQANAAGNLVSVSLNNLVNWLNRAQSQTKTDHFERCISNIEKLEENIINSTWIIDARNDQGRALTYAKNVRWRCEQLLEAVAFLDSLP